MDTQCYVARQHNGCTHLSEFQSMSLVLLSLLLVQLFCLTILSAYYQSTQALCPTGLLKDFRHFELKEALLSLIWQKIIRKSRRFSHTSVSNVEITAEGSTISILAFSMLPNPASPVSHIKYVFDWVTLACLSGGALNHWMIWADSAFFHLRWVTIMLTLTRNDLAGSRTTSGWMRNWVDTTCQGMFIFEARISLHRMRSAGKVMAFLFLDAKGVLVDYLEKDDIIMGT